MHSIADLKRIAEIISSVNIEEIIIANLYNINLFLQFFKL